MRPNPAGMTVLFLLSALAGWILMDLRYSRQMRHNSRQYLAILPIPQRDRAAIGRGPILTTDRRTTDG